MKEKFDRLVFVVPDPESFISGGNIYNLHFLKALRTIDPSVINVDFDVFQKEYHSGQDLLFFDSIYFESLKKYEGDLSKAYLIVHHLESLNQKDADRISFFQKEEKAVLDRFGGFLSTSFFTQEYLNNLGYTKAKHICLPPAITFQAKPQKQTSEKIRALMVNNLIERKGIVEFFTCLRDSNISEKQFQITLIGNKLIEPAYAAECEKYLTDPKLKKLVKYIGEQPRQQVMRYFEKSNLYISTAYMETFGIALQEAVAYRLPVLAYDGGNAKYHIEEGRNGMLFSSIESLVQQIEKIAKRPDQFQKLINKAWAFRKFENYTWFGLVKEFVVQLASNY